MHCRIMEVSRATVIWKRACGLSPPDLTPETALMYRPGTNTYFSTKFGEEELVLFAKGGW